jgi:ParB-like chromosome segregation protein Spo0J
MANQVAAAFEPQVLRLPMTALLPLRTVSPAVKASSKYRQIAASIASVGIIEPIVVARSKTHAGRYLLLDGHLRHAVLVESGATEASCLVATDDEAFTYNKRINRLAPIQEHMMIVRALERGVSDDRLAKALNLDVRGIKRRRTMLIGICPEVVDLLKDRPVNATIFGALRKMRPVRQIEAAELMITAGNFSASYARALLAATKQAHLVKSDQPKKVGGLTPEQMARMEREMETLQQDMKSVESRYGDDVLNLVIASGYLSKLLGNNRVSKYLQKRHPELLNELQTIVAAGSLEQGTSS